MKDEDRLYRQVVDFVMQPHRKLLAEAFVTGKAVRVFVADDEIRMEAFDPHDETHQP